MLISKRNTYNLAEYNELTFKELNKDINYIYPPTFDGSWFSKISEFYRKHDSIIQSKPKLIIDVRNNGGGSDACAYPLLKYIFNKPFKDDKVEIFATKENIRKSMEWYNTIKNDTSNYDKAYLEECLREIKQMKLAPNQSFILRSEAKTITLDKVPKQPKNVLIITNKYCASACETLLFWAMESDKTLIVGENSGGYVGYGEIGTVRTPLFNFYLGCTMTRYDKQRAFETEGISPQVYFDNASSWIEQAYELIDRDK